MIALQPENLSEYVHIPRGVTLEYLQEHLGRELGYDPTIRQCKLSNLCASNDMRVSNSGATVLRLAIDLADGSSLDCALKVLSPDSVNIFKIDRRFEARFWETALMRWWGEQQIPQIPIVYDVRSDSTAREYWILQEYFPYVGISQSGQPADNASRERLIDHVAALHAYSGSRTKELDAFHAGNDFAQGSRYTPEMLTQGIENVLTDSEFVSKIVALSKDELTILTDCLSLIERRPKWVDEWDHVCANRDFSDSNTAVRETSHGSELVSFDWGAAHIGPIEQDFDVLLGRDLQIEKAEKDALVKRYLDVYADLTGRRIDFDVFMARIPWARLMVTLRYALEHLLSLQWMPWQSRSLYFIHFFIGLSSNIAAEIQRKE